MLKSVKIPEEAYKLAKILARELEKQKVFKGVYRVSISMAISYAITKTLEDLRRIRKF